MHDVEGKIMTTDNLLLDEEKVVECFTLPALRCAWERVLKKDAQDGDISDSPKSSERGRTGPRT